MSHIYIAMKSKWVTYTPGSLGALGAMKLGYTVNPIAWMSPETIQQYILKHPSHFIELRESEKDFSEHVATNGLYIMCGNNNIGGCENEHMSHRGYHDLIGDVVFFAETIGHTGYREPVDTNMAMILVESILESRGKNMIDCMVHEFRRTDNHRVKLDKYVNKTKQSGDYSQEALDYVSSRGRLVIAPDDSDDIPFCELSCVACGGYENPQSVSCECMRATYCNESCRKMNWAFHSKYIHTKI